MLETYYNHNIQKSKFLYFFKHFIIIFLKTSSCFYSHNGTKIKPYKDILFFIWFFKKDE